MPLAEAIASGLLENPGASEGVPCDVACHQPEQDRQALRQLAVECEQFSPLVGLDEGDEPDGLRMDLRGLAMLFGSERALTERVAEFFQRQGYQVRMAVADTASAAGALARYHPEAASCMIAASGDRGVLAELPVAALRLSETTGQLLQHLGIHCLGQLQGLPRSSLAARFEPRLLQRLDQITGVVDELIVACRPPEDWTVQMAFEHPVSHPEAIAGAIQQLLAQLVSRLIVQGMGILQLECRLQCQNRQACEIRIGLFQPTADPEHLLGLIRMQLERLKLPEPVQEIQVAAISTAVREQRQSGLFTDAGPRDPAKLGLLIERLSTRLGHEQVLQARLQADSQIERAYQCQPLAGRGTPRAARASAADPPAASGPMFRPLWLFDPPRPIQVVGLAMEGPPAKFFDRQEVYRVARCFGPERIETGWWRGPSVRRDYYRVETTLGNRLWLFRQLPDQQWFLHGEFA
jgi:protein ImuB